MEKYSILMIGNYLTSKGWNVNISHYLAEHLSKAGWKVIKTSSKENQVFRLFDMLITLLRFKNQYQIAQIDVFSGKAFIFAELCTLLLLRLKKPVVLTLHGGGLPEFSVKNPRRIKFVLNSANVVVTPSPFIKANLLHFRKDIQIIPNPINLSLAIFRERKIISPNLIWVRAFHHVYNPVMMPKVIHQLSKEFPDVHITMLGPDRGDGSLEEMVSLARKLGVEDKFTIPGKIENSEIPLWLDQADIFVNSTNYDTSPISLLEAMGNGLCIVTTKVGGIPYMVTDGESGLLVPPNDPSEMAKACIKILRNPAFANQLSNSARKYAEKSDWKVIFPLWETLLNQLINNA